MLQHGNVADDPSYLSDIAAAIADCETHEYQEILEETNVSTWPRLVLSHSTLNFIYSNNTLIINILIL